MNTLISKITKSTNCFYCGKYYLECHCKYDCYPYPSLNDDYIYSFTLNDTTVFITAKINNKFVIDVPSCEIKFISDDITIKDLIEQIETYMVFQ